MSQSDQKSDQHPDEQLTQLVSYLDGELSLDEMTQMEVSLVNDPSMRSEADILSRTWALLDDVAEDVPQSQSFTQDTLATIKTMEAEEPSPSRPQPRWESLMAFAARYQLVPAVLLGILVGLGTFVLGQRLEAGRANHPNHRAETLLLQNLDVLQSRELYDFAPSAAQLKQLQIPDADEE